jgi:hypothetical protein
LTTRKTFQEAAVAYCTERAAIAELNGRIGAIGRCEIEEPPDDEARYPGQPRCTDALADSGPEGGPQWWQASPERIAEDFCDRCQAKVPLWRERRQRKARLSGLMRSMLAAYRREAEASRG